MQTWGTRRGALGVLGVLAIGALVAGCGGGEDRSKAQVRLINATTGYASLDLLVDDDRVQQAVAYGQTDGYAEVDPDETETEITRNGSSAELYRAEPALQRGKRYSLVAYGREGAFRAVLLDDNTDEPDSGDVDVRVLNGAPEAGELDVYLTPADTDLADAEPLHPGAPAGEATDYATIDAAAWQLTVTAAGDAQDVRLILPDIVLESRQRVTVVLTPGGGGALVNAILLVERGDVTALTGGHARVRAVAGAAGSAAVSASVNGVPLMSGTGAPAVGAYRLVPAGAAAASATVAGAAVTVPARTLDAGSDYTLLTWGTPAAAQAAWLSDDNRPSTVASRVKLRLVHGVAELDGTLALTVDFVPRADGVLPGSASVPVEFDATSTAVFAVTSPEAGELINHDERVLQAGGVYSVFVVGALDAPVDILSKDR